MRRKIACVLNRSETYQSEYVGRLFDGISANLRGFEFVVVQSTRWPGWWSKMELFDPELRGDILYFDLDTIIVGPIHDLFIGKLTMLSDFNMPNSVASGVMFLPEADRKEVWDKWINNPEQHMHNHSGKVRGMKLGDGGFLETIYRDKALRWQNERPGKLVSYKNHCQPAVPAGASVVCFHGTPKPKDIHWKLH